MKRKPRKNCICCKKEIHRSSNKQGNKLRRGEISITCSKDCAKEYARIFKYQRGLK